MTVFCCVPLAKRPRKAPFSELVRTAPTYAETRDGKHVSRLLDEELWDEQGRYWRQDRWVSFKEAKVMLDRGTPLVVADFGSHLLAFVPSDKRAEICDRLKGETTERRGWSPCRYSRGRDELLVLHGYC